MTVNREPQVITLTPEQASQDPLGLSDNHILQQVAAIRNNGQPVQAQQVQQQQAPAPTPAPAPVPQPVTPAPAPAVPDDLDLSDPTSLESIGLEEPGTLEPETPPTTDFQMEAFEKAFQAKYGVDLADAIASVQDIQQYRVKQQVREQEQQLASEWGVPETEAQARLDAVRERFSKYDDAKKATLSKDPLRAAQLIWQQLEREQASRQTPAFDRSRGAYVSNQAKTYTAAELAAMPEEQYAREQASIIEAYRTGRVTY